MRRARAYIGRVWGFQVQWISLGVVHSYTRLADWYESLLDELPSLSALYTDIEIARDQELLNREQAQLEKRARQLASSPEFHKSPKTYTAQNRIALKHFPDISFNDLRALVRVAREIYELEVLPSYEKELAQRARSMLDEGSSRTKTAAKLGVSYSRLD